MPPSRKDTELTDVVKLNVPPPIDWEANSPGRCACPGRIKGRTSPWGPKPTAFASLESQETGVLDTPPGGEGIACEAANNGKPPSPLKRQRSRVRRAKTGFFKVLNSAFVQTVLYLTFVVIFQVRTTASATTRHTASACHTWPGT